MSESRGALPKGVLTIASARSCAPVASESGGSPAISSSQEPVPAPKLRRRVGLKEVAARVDLSISAVSRVLGNVPAARTIPEETRRRIREAALELGYKPNALARALQSRSSMTIGILVPEISEGYATLILSGIEERLKQESYFYFVVSHHRQPDMIRRYQELLMERAVEGLVAIDTPFTSHPSIPTVAISGRHEHDSVTSIVLDHHLAATQALEHLAGLGHRRIACIRGQTFSSDTDARWDAIVAAAHASGVTIDPALVIALEGDSPSHGPGYEATRTLLDCGVAFTALFAFNDVAAIGAIKALQEAGLRVPEDVSVVGFDDVQSAAFQNPALSTVRQPLRDMGLLAAKTLLHEIKTIKEQGSEAAPQRLVVLPEFIIRASTGPVATRLRTTAAARLVGPPGLEPGTNEL